MFDLIAYLERQWSWSAKTFGPGRRTGGVTQHIEKECAEIRAKPDDLEEWADVIILGLDGFWRAAPSKEIALQRLGQILQAKQDKNFARKWPAPVDEDTAVEHDRSHDEPVPAIIETVGV